MDKCSSLRTKEQKWSPQVEPPLSLPGKPSQTPHVYLAKGSETYETISRTQLFSFFVNQFVSSPYYKEHFLSFNYSKNQKARAAVKILAPLLSSSSSVHSLCLFLTRRNLSVIRNLVAARYVYPGFSLPESQLSVNFLVA